MFLCIVYLIVITILFVCSYKLFQEKYAAKPWGEVKSVEEYTYIEVSRMSEKFAYYEEENLGIHFVIEKEDTGQWHTYLIGINEKEYDALLRTKSDIKIIDKRAKKYKEKTFSS